MKIIFKDTYLRNKLAMAGLITVSECTAEENKQYMELVNAKESLPSGVYRGEYLRTFIKTTPAEVSDTEELIFIEALKTKNVITIKHWLTFFGVLAILGLIGGLITVIAVFA